MPGGGTTDYAVEIYHEAIKNGNYDCFLTEDTYLPMMFMDDAIKATISIMTAASSNLTIRSSYNLGSMSFSPKEIANSIKSYMPEFEISYTPDFRQAIANSWPQSIDDNKAREDWNWESSFNLDKTTKVMLEELKKRLVINN